jgi:RNA 2',3'-cyclic 3'-phosphodiesterase
MRLFLGIWIDETVLEGLEEPLGKLREAITRQGVRFTRPERIHLTVRFLGNVMEDALPDLTASLREGLQGAAAPQLEVSEIGGFPGLHRPAVVWAGVSGPLEELHRRVVEATDVFAERPDDKEFRPHLTLARVSPPSQKVGRALEPVVQEFRGKTFCRWTPAEVVLVESTSGAYEVRERFALTRSDRE